MNLSKKIMVVEDENIIALDLKKRVTSLGYSVAAVAATGEEAIKLVEQSKPDLILMDIYLRGQIDGIDTAIEISKHHHIPIIYVTSYIDDINLRRLKTTTVSGHIIKPVDQNELKVKIENALFN